MRALPKALPVLLLAAALLTGCSGSGGSDDTASTAGAALDSGGAVAEAPGAGSTGGGAAAPEKLQVTDLRAAPGLAVIRTAELDVRVDEVRAAADEAGRAARAAGGGVDAEERTGSGDDGSATLTLRVPPKAFDTTIDALAGLGEERSRRLGSEDVTDQVVDLEARLATQRASVDRVRTLLGEAEKLGEVVQIEAELTKRTADLEALEARLESLNARVDLSTITLRLTRLPEAAAAAGAAGFGDGLAAGWAALAGTGRVLSVTAGALLPFLPVLLVVGYLVWRARSRRPGVVQP
jgi:hypothetical protein